MNNREWLNTLSDEEYAEEWLKIEKMLHGDCGFHIEVIIDWLSQPHETTADEDFAEIGFKPYNAGVTKAHWFQRECRDYVSIYEATIGYDGIFTDEEIDQIRKIADKKRKEMGWK